MSLKIGIVGYGYWGPNLVRNFNKTDGCEVISVCDRSQERLVQAKKMLRSWQSIDFKSNFIPPIDL